MTLTEEEAEKVIRQLCEGKEYYDPDSEYIEGESQRYSFFRAEEKFYLQRMDVIVGAYCTMEEVSKEYLLNYFLGQHSSALTEQNFKF